MSLKKAYCPHCHTANDRYHIFEVNAEADVCYCPHCMAKLNPNEAIRAYDVFIEKKITKANLILYSAIDFEKAYGMFAHILEIDAHNVDALYGRLLSLLYMSTLRKAKFKDFVLLFDEEKSLFHEEKNASSYFAFLGHVLCAVNEYDFLFRHRLMIHQYFYDIDCIKLYFSHLQDMHDLKQDIYEEYRYLESQKKPHPDLKVAMKNLEASIQDKNIELTKRWLTIDGYSYGYVGVSERGDVLLGRSDRQNKIKISHYSPKALREENAKKGRKLIKDHVYPNNLTLYRLMKVMLPLAIVFFAFFVFDVLGVIIAHQHFDDVIFIILMCASFCLALVSLIFFIFSHQKLEKRHRLIN